jgi:hypothetical protein
MSEIPALTGSCRNGHPWSSSAYTKKNGKFFCRVCCAKRRSERRSLALRFPERVQPAEIRLMQRIDNQPGHGPNGDCWIYTNAHSTAGYGQISRDHKLIYVHRLVYEMVFGPIPDGLDLLHKCDWPPCCRPTHLTPGTHAENMADMSRKERGTCKLTWDQVRQIRAERAQGCSTLTLANKYGVVRTNIGFIVNNKTWKENYDKSTAAATSV